MKNTIIIIFSNLFFILSVLAANPEYKADKKTTDSQRCIKNQITQEEGEAKKFQKKQLDITVQKDDKFIDKSVNWGNKEQKIGSKKDSGNGKFLTKNEKSSQDFHKWANKTQDSIDFKMKQKDPKYQSSNPFSDITNPTAPY
jgi:phenylalanyl-tRNA synthetase alpha subunit